MKRRLALVALALALLLPLTAAPASAGYSYRCWGTTSHTHWGWSGGTRHTVEWLTYWGGRHYWQVTRSYTPYAPWARGSWSTWQTSTRSC